MGLDGRWGPAVWLHSPKPFREPSGYTFLFTVLDSISVPEAVIPLVRFAGLDSVICTSLSSESGERTLSVEDLVGKADQLRYSPSTESNPRLARSCSPFGLSFP